MRTALGRALAAWTGVAAAWSAVAPNVDEIVARSVANNQANWEAAPRFTFRERDIITKHGDRHSRTYRVRMVEGSPYNETIAVDGKPLDAAAMEQQKKALKNEIERRRHESAGARRERIEKYERERRQDHALMREMIKGFVFKLAGTESVDGHECFRVQASPRPGYNPPSRETKVLTGMRGTLWIDTAQYQWVKVTASVFRPVAFGLFIAKVQPGTEFTLEEAPVEGGLWMPVHFQTRVRARILLWSHNSAEDDAYSDYKRAAAAR